VTVLFYLVRLVEKQTEICEDDPQLLPAGPALEFAEQIAAQKTLQQQFTQNATRQFCAPLSSMPTCTTSLSSSPWLAQKNQLNPLGLIRSSYT